jgi:hypothetical protein
MRRVGRGLTVVAGNRCSGQEEKMGWTLVVFPVSHCSEDKV